MDADSFIMWLFSSFRACRGFGSSGTISNVRDVSQLVGPGEMPTLSLGATADTGNDQRLFHVSPADHPLFQV